jgi:hypothetical protein
MKKIFFFLFLVSCSSTNLKTNSNNDLFDFNRDLTFNEFKQLLDKYNEKSNFPNIDR